MGNPQQKPTTSQPELPHKKPPTTASVVSHEIANLQQQIDLAELRRRLAAIDAALHPLHGPRSRLAREKQLEKRDLEWQREDITLQIRELELPSQIESAELDWQHKEASGKSPEALAALERRISRRDAGRALGSPRSRYQLLQDLKRKSPNEEAEAQLKAVVTSARADLAKLKADLGGIPARRADISRKRAELRQLRAAMERTIPTKMAGEQRVVNHKAGRVTAIAPEVKPMPPSSGTSEFIRFRKHRGGKITAVRGYSSVALCNTYDRLSSELDHTRTLVIQSQGHIEASKLRRMFANSELDKAADAGDWTQWIDTFRSEKHTGKAAALVLLENKTGLLRTTLKTKISKARSRDKNRPATSE